MRIYLTATFLIILMQFGYSQNSNNRPLNRAIGIDLTFINNFLPLDNPIGFRGPYLFHYIKYKENNKFFKQALDFNLIGAFENNESEVDRDDFRIDIEYKISRGKRKTFFKEKLSVLLGPEMSFRYFLNKSNILDTNDPLGERKNERTDQRFSTSFGAFVGIGYNITNRISIYTEAGAALWFSYEIDTFNSSLNPTNDFKDKRFLILTSYVLPSSIILFYHF